MTPPEEQATRLRNELNLTQAEFARLSDERRFAHYTRYLGYALDSIEACTIRAPHAGRVVYANDWNRRSYGRTEIELGAEVDYRQAIVDLPDYSRFVVQAWVHEAVINDLVPGQPVTVRIPALDNVKLTGSLSEVARFPTVRNYFQPGVREFQVEIEFDDGQEPLQKLAPRMDANAEILVDFDLDVLQVPLGCIIHPDRQAHVIVSDGMSLQARPVETGRTDETNVEILSGLEPGDLVVVSPSAELQQRVFDAAGDAGESADS